MNVWYAFISVMLVSFTSVVVGLPLLMKKKISNGLLIFLLSMSVGVLLSVVFIDFLPEVYEHGESLFASLYIILGFLVMFILEKLIHYHHSKKCENDNCGHSHAYNVAPINLIGDGIHNFIDGLVIVASYSVNIGVGIATTISIIFHEVPQEIADFGVLLYSGLSKKKVLLFNALSALTSVVGMGLGFFLLSYYESINTFIIPFASGNFIYIAASNLVPQLHRHCKLKDTLLHIGAIVLGVGVIVAVTLLLPGHAHS